MAKARRALDTGGVLDDAKYEAARDEARRRIARARQHAIDQQGLVPLGDRIALIDQLLTAGAPIAEVALCDQRDALADEQARLRIAINSTSTIAWGGDEQGVRARDDEGLDETTLRVLVDRGATGYQIVKYFDETKDASRRKQADRWRAAYRSELEAFRADLGRRPSTTARIAELIAQIDEQLARLGGGQQAPRSAERVSTD